MSDLFVSLTHSNLLFYLIVIISYISTSNADPFCSPNDITPVIDPKDLPQLSNEFQTRIQATFLAREPLRCVDVLILYDANDRRAEIVTQDENSYEKRVFYYDKNEYFVYIGIRKSL
jgi:hypothetical protein